MSMTVSFIIPHKGREEMLVQTLHSIYCQDFQRSELEVVIVTQNQELFVDLALEFDGMQISVVYNKPENTISNSRNIGAQMSKGTYLAFLDADVSLEENWTSNMLRAITQTPSVVLCAGTQVLPEQSTPIERIRTALASCTAGQVLVSAPGANLFISREIFMKTGGFPEQLKTCEDIFFTQKAGAFGEILHVKEAAFIHLGEDKAYIPMFKKEIWRGQSNLASLSGRRIPLREWPSFVVPFAVTLGILMAVIFFAVGAHTLAALLALCGLIPLTVYSLRLKRLTGRTTSLAACIGFYVMYFPARALGTSLGIMSTVSTSSHK